MTNLQPIIEAATTLRTSLETLKLDHPWDANVAKNSAARLDAMLSDLRVAACRMQEDQPRVTRDPATDQTVPVEDESLRAEVVSRTTTEDATVIDRVDGTRTTVKLDGVVICEHTPITEDLMRRAQVGWVVRTVGGNAGRVVYVCDGNFDVQYIGTCLAYEHRHAGKCLPERFSNYDLVSLSPPDVVADVEEVVL